VNYRSGKELLNKYIYKSIDGDKRPVYFDIDKDYPALNDVTQNFATIRDEFESLMSKKLIMPKYHDIDPGEKEISDASDKKWNVFMMYLLGHKPEENRQHCPETCRILDRIPGLIQAFFSIMEPGKCVPLHNGPMYSYLR